MAAASTFHDTKNMESTTAQLPLDSHTKITADAATGAAARKAQASSTAAEAVDRWETVACRVALRLAAIEARHRGNGPTLVPQPRLAGHLQAEPSVDEGSIAEKGLLTIDAWTNMNSRDAITHDTLLAVYVRVRSVKIDNRLNFE